MGLEVDEEEMWGQFGTGGVSYGQTKGANIPLVKNGKPILSKSGKPMNRSLRVVIYKLSVKPIHRFCVNGM